MIPSFYLEVDRVLGVTKQWGQIVAIWIGVLISGIATLVFAPEDARYLLFSSIAAAAIALVSIEHLLSSSAKDTVRQQVYVSAGAFAILATLTLISLLG